MSAAGDARFITRLTRHDRGASEACSRFLKRFGTLFEQRRRRNKSRANDVTENKFFSFNEALSGDAYFVHVPRGTTVEEPVRIRINHPSPGRVSLPLVYIHLEPGAALDLIVEYRDPDETDAGVRDSGAAGSAYAADTGTDAGAGPKDPAAAGSVATEAPSGATPGRANAGLTEVPATACVVIKGLLERDARLSMLRLQDVPDHARHFAFERIMVEENAVLRADSVTLGGAVAMVEGLYSLMGPESRAEVRDLTGARGQQFTGMKLTVEHNAPHSYSDAAIKTVLDDESSGMFTGNIKIPSGSPHSQGYEEHRTLLLGDGAHVQSIPQLEIIENDVRCSHGSTVTSTVDDDLYYLRSRGLDTEYATRLLVSAFYQDVLRRMDLPTRNADARRLIMEPLRSRTGLEFDWTEIW